MSFNGFRLFELQVILLSILAGLSINAWAYFDEDGFGESMVEPDMSLWLQRRFEPLQDEVSYSDSPWDSTPMYAPVLDHAEARYARSMENRAERDLELTRRVLNGEAVPFDAKDETSTIPRRVPRSAGLSPLNSQNESWSSYHWKPIAIGTICAIFGMLVIVGATLYYQKTRSIQKHGEGGEDGIGPPFRDRKGQPNDLLSESSLLSVNGDRKLAHSAQMYHYQHQKQQMLAVERATDHAQVSDEGSASDVDEGDFTVFECPGLAESGQMELENPLYEGDSTVPGATVDGVTDAHREELDDESDSTPTGKTMIH